jgi:hypothetical protein
VQVMNFLESGTQTMYGKKDALEKVSPQPGAQLTIKQASCRVHNARLSILSHCRTYDRRECLAMLPLPAVCVLCSHASGVRAGKVRCTDAEEADRDAEGIVPTSWDRARKWLPQIRVCNCLDMGVLMSRGILIANNL